MSIKLRKRKSFKKKAILYLFLLVFSGFFSFFIYANLPLDNSSFISPLGKDTVDIKMLKKTLKDNKVIFSEVVVLGDSSYVVSFPNSKEARLSSQKDIGKQVSSLQRILRQLTIEGKSFESIDFRFKEPVVSF